MTDPSLREQFEALLDLEPAARAAALARLDPERAQVLAELLASDDESGELPGFEQGDLRRFLAARPAEFEPGARLGNFEIDGRLGAGGMGTVYAARQLHPERPVALKVLHLGLLDERRLERFEWEIETLSRLRHPGIATLHDAGIARFGEGAGALDVPYFAMELVADAEPIVAYCEARRLPLEVRVELIRQVLDALSHAHSVGVLHRDLKPANLLVGGDGRVKLIDFGIARALDDGRGHTRSGEWVGSLGSAAPEQLSATDGEIGVPTDVYGVGVVLYTLVTGTAPIDPQTTDLAELVLAVRDREVTPPTKLDASLPRELDWILACALHKRADQRYASARDFERDLERLLLAEPVQAAPPSPWYPLRKWVARHRAVAGLLVLLLAAVIGGVTATGLGLQRALAAEKELGQNVLELEDETASLRELYGYLDALLRAPDPRRFGRDVRVVELLEGAAARLDLERLGVDTRANLHFSMAQALLALGEPAAAEAQVELGLACVEHLENSRDSGTSIHWSDARQARFAFEQLRAESQLDRERPDLALQTLTRLQADWPTSLNVRSAFSLARAYVLLRQPEPARELLDRYADRWQELDHLQSLRPGSVENLAASLASLEGDLEGARQQSQRAWELRTAELDERHPASLFLAIERLRHALPFEEEVPEILSQVAGHWDWLEAEYGREHPTYMRMASSLSEAYFRVGDSEAALAVLERALAGEARTEEAYLRLVNNRGGMAYREGRLDEAIADFRTVLERCLAELPWALESNPGWGINAIAAHTSAGDHAAVVELGEQLLARAEFQRGADTSALTRIRTWVGNSNMHLGQWSAGELRFDELLAELEPDDDPRAWAVALHNRVYCLNQQGRYAESIPVYEAAIERFRGWEFDPQEIESHEAMLADMREQLAQSSGGD